jgi:hypothetical protein
MSQLLLLLHFYSVRTSGLSLAVFRGGEATAASAARFQTRACQSRHQRKSLATDVLYMRRAVAALASNANFLPRHFSASPASTHHSPPPPASPSSTFIEDPAVAFKDKTDIEIARAWLVFRLCAIRPVVENASQLLKLSR